MNNQPPSLNKSFDFNPRYKNTKAFGETMSVVKACGNVQFYNYLYDKIGYCSDYNHVEGLRAFLIDLEYLTPKPTNVSKELCLKAQKILDDTVEYVAINGYSKSVEFEELHHYQQVYFSLMGMFNILALTQKVEATVHHCEIHGDKILAKHRKEELRKQSIEKAKNKRFKR